MMILLGKINPVPMGHMTEVCTCHYLLTVGMSFSLADSQGLLPDRLIFKKLLEIYLFIYRSLLLLCFLIKFLFIYLQLHYKL